MLVPLALLSGFQAIRQEFIPEEWQARLALLNWIPQWSAWTWATLGLAIGILIVLESAFRMIRSNAASVHNGAQDKLSPIEDKSALAGDVRIITMPGIETLTPSVRFTTEGKRGQSFNLRERPTALRFVTLGGRIVKEVDLPVEIPCGNGKLVIKRFTDSGFLWDEEGTVGDRVQVEFYPLATSIADENPETKTVLD